MNILDSLLVGGIFAFLILPALIYKQGWLALVFLVFGLCFGLIEFLSVKFTGLSVSQHFWALRGENYRHALTIAICMLIAWLFLLAHFMVK